MSLSDGAVAWALELFESLGPITTRKMMGGLCLYLDGQIFAILDSQGTLFLKAGPDFARTLEQAGARQFGAGTGRTMGYWDHARRRAGRCRYRLRLGAPGAGKPVNRDQTRHWSARHCPLEPPKPQTGSPT